MITIVEHPIPKNPQPRQPVFADIAAILESGLEAERPSVAEVCPGSFLFYKGRINEIHGEPGMGKTNAAIASAAAVMSRGGVVLYIDPEDHPEGILRKFKAFGVADQTLIECLKYSHNPAPAEFTLLIEWSREHQPELVILDGLAEALAAEGLNEDIAGDVLTFFRLRVRPFADAGAAVLLSDHVIKSLESRGRWARGSGAKLGRYDGAVYSVELVKAYSPAVAGAIRLVLSKDRCGGVGPVGASVVEIHFAPGENGGTDLSFEKPPEKGEFLPTALMEKISRRLEIMPDSTKRDLRSLGNSGYVDIAIEKLTSAGHLEVVPGGQGRATLFRLLHPYREGCARVPERDLNLAGTPG